MFNGLAVATERCYDRCVARRLEFGDASSLVRRSSACDWLLPSFTDAGDDFAVVRQIIQSSRPYFTPSPSAMEQVSDHNRLQKRTLD